MNHPPFTVPQIAEQLGSSRSLAYRLAKEGQLPSIRIRQQRLVVPQEALTSFLANAEAVKK